MTSVLSKADMYQRIKKGGDVNLPCPIHLNNPKMVDLRKKKYDAKGDIMDMWDKLKHDPDVFKKPFGNANNDEYYNNSKDGFDEEYDEGKKEQFLKYIKV